MFGLAFGLFFLLLLLGVPIAFSMGLGSAIALFLSGAVDPVLVGHKLFTGVDSFSLMAIPFFMLSGELMEQGGLSKRLVDLSSALIGHITGGLAIMSIVVSVFWGAISGAGPANAATTGTFTCRYTCTALDINLKTVNHIGNFLYSTFDIVERRSD